MIVEYRNIVNAPIIVVRFSKYCDATQRLDLKPKLKLGFSIKFPIFDFSTNHPILPMFPKNIITVLLLTLCIACITNTSKATQNLNELTAYSLNSFDDDAINERGLLKSVEDSGYPMATLTIEFPERNFTEHFIINLEAVKGVTMNNLNKWVGKYVAFSYTSDFANTLMDLRVNGKSIFNDNPIEITAETKKITGILKGAKAETSGDLPDKISIVSKDNNLTFDFFITKEVVNVNGKKVTGFYEERVENTIKSIKLSR